MSLNSSSHVKSVSLTPSSNNNHFRIKSLPSRAHFRWRVSFYSFMPSRKGCLCTMHPMPSSQHLSATSEKGMPIPGPGNCSTNTIILKSSSKNVSLKMLCRSINMSICLPPRSRRDMRKWEVISMDTRYLLSFFKNSWLSTMHIAWLIKGLRPSTLQTISRRSSVILPRKGFCRAILVHFRRIGISMTTIQETKNSAKCNYKPNLD